MNRALRGHAVAALGAYLEVRSDLGTGLRLRFAVNVRREQRFQITTVSH
jgi:hypothetical protein